MVVATFAAATTRPSAQVSGAVFSRLKIAPASIAAGVPAESEAHPLAEAGTQGRAARPGGSQTRTAAAAGSCMAGSAAQDPRAQARAIIDQMGEAVRNGPKCGNAVTLRAGITMTTSTPRVRESQTWRGTFYLSITENEGSARVKFIDPAIDILLLDEQLTIYVPWKQTIFEISGQSAMQNYTRFFVSPADILFKNSLVKLSRSEGQYCVLESTPDETVVSFRSATVWVNRATFMPEKWKIVQDTSTRLITLSNIKRGACLAEDKFKLNYPAAARVVIP